MIHPPRNRYGDAIPPNLPAYRAALASRPSFWRRHGALVGLIVTLTLATLFVLGTYGLLLMQYVRSLPA
jgi:hypothetical protein